MNADEIQEFLWEVISKGDSSTVVGIDDQVEKIIHKWLTDVNERVAETYNRYKPH